jgi:hypothetical protein
MIFGNVIKEEADINDVDLLAGEADPETEEGMEAIATEVENNMQVAALENVTYFDGGEDAQKAFTESTEVQALVEARKMSKKTFVRLNKNDDFTRRAHLASLILARNAKDPLFNKLALNRVKERELRRAIFKKYENKARSVAKKSQAQHIKNMKKMPALPKINF